jgi:hypothetical protein
MIGMARFANNVNEKVKKVMRKEAEKPQDLPPAAAQTGEPIRGFISAPTPEQLKPTAREVSLLETLWSWQEKSAKSRIVLGQPLRS